MTMLRKLSETIANLSMGYQSNADDLTNGDGGITIKDLYAVAIDFGKSVSLPLP